MPTYLDALLDGARDRVAAARETESYEDLRQRAASTAAGPSMYEALAAPGVRVIAEIKRASPSKGDLAPDIVAADRARLYRDGGASAISVLTEPAQFKGSLQDLRDVAALGVPALRKDFIIDPYQVWEARAAGASAALLIVAALTPKELQSLVEEIRAAGLEPLVETHDESEAAAAVACGVRLIGVNARDLKTFEIDRDAFARVRPQLGDDIVAIAESGIRGPDDVRAAAAAGADAVLVGETLVTADDPQAALAALVAAGQQTRTTSGQASR